MAIYVPHSKILIAGLSYVRPVAGVSYLQVKVTAEVTMPDVLAVDIITPSEDLIFAFDKKLTDSQVLRDKAIRAVNKALADNAVLSEYIRHINTSKKLSDTQSISEALLYTFIKGTISDTSVASDTWQLGVDKLVSPDSAIASDQITSVNFTKVLADTITMSDVTEAHKLYIRVFADDLTVPDAEFWSFVAGTTAETAAASDVYAHVLTKNLFESTVLIDNMDGDIQYSIIKLIGELLTSNDAKVIDFAANKSDNLTSSDGGVLSMQDYSDITYFLEDYVGISRTF